MPDVTCARRVPLRCRCALVSDELRRALHAWVVSRVWAYGDPCTEGTAGEEELDHSCAPAGVSRSAVLRAASRQLEQRCAARQGARVGAVPICSRGGARLVSRLGRSLDRLASGQGESEGEGEGDRVIG